MKKPLDDDETDDARRLAKRLGYDPADFEFWIIPSAPLTSRPGPIVADVVARYGPTGAERLYEARDGTAWPVDFEEDLKAGAFRPS